MAVGLRGSSRTTGRGFSLLEVLLAVLFLAILLTSFLNVHVQSNLPRQVAIRDYATLLNVCERRLNQTHEALKQGAVSLCFHENITSDILQSPSIVSFTNKFHDSTELLYNFTAYQSIIGNSETSLIEIRITCTWGRSRTDPTLHRSLCLQTFVNLS